MRLACRLLRAPRNRRQCGVLNTEQGAVPYLPPCSKSRYASGITDRPLIYINAPKSGPYHAMPNMFGDRYCK
jgi:hypothetical protein